MSNSLIAYNFHNSNVRVLNNNQNEYLFCLADVCASLQLTNANNIVNQIKEEFSIPMLNIGVVTRPDGSRIEANFITEPQLYFVMMRSRAKVAREFRQWICNEVLPSIRKKGSYSAKNEFNAGYEVGMATGKEQIKQEYENKLKDYKGNQNLSVSKEFKSADDKFKFGIDKNSLVFEFLKLKKKIKANKEQWNRELEELQNVTLKVSSFVEDCLSLDEQKIE